MEVGTAGHRNDSAGPPPPSASNSSAATPFPKLPSARASRPGRYTTEIEDHSPLAALSWHTFLLALHDPAAAAAAAAGTPPGCARAADSGKSNQFHAVLTMCPAKQGTVYAGLGRPGLSHVEVAVAGHIAVAVALIGGADGCIAAGDRAVGKLDHERLAGGHLWTVNSHFHWSILRLLEILHRKHGIMGFL